MPQSKSSVNDISGAGAAVHYDATGARVSDPTPLTTQQLLREIFQLRELVEARIKGVEVRMEASDEAVRLLQRFADRTPTTKDVENNVERLREVTSEKFTGVQTQITERDLQVDRAVKDVKEATDKAARDVKSAVDAAFAASKEVVSEQNKSNAAAIDKSEKAFTKQIDGLNDLIKTTAKATDDKINDIKERITIIESKTSVSDPSSAIAIAELKASVHRLSSTTDISSGRQAGMTAMWALILAIISGAVGVVSIIAIVIKFMN